MSAHDEAWLAHAVDTLREAGYRSGSARLQVLEALGGRSCCATAQGIADELRAEGRGVGTASVYRALELLVRLGLVRRLEVGDGTARYEPALPGGEHHHHLVCDRCGRVTQFEDQALEQAITGLSRRLDFATDTHDVVLRGVCTLCRTPAGSAAGPG